MLQSTLLEIWIFNLLLDHRYWEISGHVLVYLSVSDSLSDSLSHTHHTHICIWVSNPNWATKLIIDFKSKLCLLITVVKNILKSFHFPFTGNHPSLIPSYTVALTIPSKFPGCAHIKTQPVWHFLSLTLTTKQFLYFLWKKKKV